MKKRSLVSILASVGIVYFGSVSEDALALAQAVEAQDMKALEQFVYEYPSSDFVVKAIELASNMECLNQQFPESYDCLPETGGATVINDSYL